MPQLTTTTNKIPIFYRLTFTIIEPLTTLYGVIIALFFPDLLMRDYFSRGLVTYAPETKTLYTQIGGMWAYFAWNGYFVLGGVHDRGLWRRLLSGMLVGDFIYYFAAAEAVGGWAAFLDVSAMSSLDVLQLQSSPICL